MVVVALHFESCINLASACHITYTLDEFYTAVVSPASVGLLYCFSTASCCIVPRERFTLPLCFSF